VAHTESANPRAVLLDQHPLVLEGVQRVVERAGVEVVGRTTSPERALALVEERSPDLLVMDVDLGEGNMDGISCLREAHARAQDLKAIVVSAREDRSQIDEAFEAGADAYVIKSAHPDDLASVVRQAFQPSIFLASGPAPPRVAPAAAGDAHDLTRREQEILALVAEGHSNAELARMLWVTEQTIKFHLSNVYRKLNVANRTEAGRWAQLHGLLQPPAESGDDDQRARMHLIGGGSR
jgi:DNA-binding NarL/FixJ family response regulator